MAKRVSISGIKEDGSRFFRKFNLSNTDRIDIENENLVSIDLSKLSECEELRVLNLKNNKLREIDLAPLASCPDLEVLDFSQNNLTDIDLLPFEDKNKITHLALWRNEFQNSEIKGLDHLHSIEVIYFPIFSSGELDIGMLKNCNKLERVEPELYRFKWLWRENNPPKIDDLPENLSHLFDDIIHRPKIMSLIGVKESGEKFDETHVVDDLVDLDLSNLDLAEVNTDNLRFCHNLEILNLSNNKLKEIDLKSLDRIENLKEINLSHNLLEKIELKLYRSLQDISLNLSHNKLKDFDEEIELGESIEDLNLSFNVLENIRKELIDLKIKKLNLSNNKLQGFGLSQIHGLGYGKIETKFEETLESINLSDNVLKYAGLASLSNCRNLRRINLTNNKMDAVNLSLLSDLTDLSELYLDDTLVLFWIDRKPPEKDIFPSGLLPYFDRLEYKESFGNFICQNVDGDQCEIEFQILDPILKIKANDLVSIDLTPVEKCLFLKEIIIVAPKLENLDLSPLEQCLNLERLELSGLKVSTLNLKSIQNNASLKEIKLDELSSLDTIDFTELEECNSLQSIIVNKSPVRELNLAPLRKLKNLRSFQIIACGQLTHLDLSPLKAVKTLSHLQIIKNHNLVSLEFSRLDNLIELDLANNKLQAIDFSFLMQCNDLSKIDISNNKLTDIDVAPFQYLINIAEINLSQNLIETINLRPIGVCSNLKCLNLAGNKFLAINLNSLKNCQELIELDMSNCDLRDIDLSPLSKCEKIEKLFLIGNNISEENYASLPKNLNLKEISIGGSEDHPIYIKSLSHLENLVNLQTSKTGWIWKDEKPPIYDNLPSELNRPRRIVYLPVKVKMKGKLANNQIFEREIDTDITELNLSGLKLKEIDLQELKYCKGLQILDISQNEIEVLNLVPLSKCLLLHTLNVSHNNLKRLDLTTIRVKLKIMNLSVLDASFNNIQEIIFPSNIGLSFTKIDLSHNQLTRLEKIHRVKHKLMEFDISFNKLEYFDLSSVINLSLKKLDLSHNKISTIEPPETSISYSLQSLEFFDLSHNELEEFSFRLFSNAKKLKILDLSSNKISSIQSYPNNLESIDKIDLSLNKMTSFENEFIKNFASKLEVFVVDESVSKSLDNLDIQAIKMTADTDVRASQTVKSKLKDKDEVEVKTTEDSEVIRAIIENPNIILKATKDIVNCSICLSSISKGEEYVLCPHCNKESHYNHLVEWIRNKGKCPICKKHLNEKMFRRDDS